MQLLEDNINCILLCDLKLEIVLMLWVLAFNYFTSHAQRCHYNLNSLQVIKVAFDPVEDEVYFSIVEMAGIYKVDLLKTKPPQFIFDTGKHLLNGGGG